MDFNLSDEQKMLVDSAQRFVREHCGLEDRRNAAKTAEGFSKENWALFADMGWLALAIPEDAGGLGGSCIDIALLLEELGTGLLPEPLIDTTVLCSTLLAASDNQTLRENLLGQVAAGECLLSLAHIEEDGRFEYDAKVSARATKTDAGWKISGTKLRVFYGPNANYWLVTARIGDADGYGVFAVERGASGVTMHEYRLIDGTCAADLVLADVPVAQENLVLRPEAAAPVLEEALDKAVVAMSATVVGSMEAVMAMTAEYLKVRVQYGQPLANFQALQHRMAEMLVETEQARSILYRALAAIESGAVEQRRRAVSGAKTLVAQSGHFVAAQGIQLHGGIGTTEEYSVGHHYKAMLVYDKRFGDAAFHLARSAGLSA